MSGGLTLVVNPRAGGGRGARVGLQALRGLRAGGMDVQVLLGDGPAALAARAADAVAGGTCALVLVGGDGLVHLGVNAVAGTSTPVGIVPAGTGNDIARGLGLPVHDPDAALAAVRAGLLAGPRLIDAVRCTGAQAAGWFAGVLAAGFDALVNERTNGWVSGWAGGWGARAGTARYLAGVARELPVLRAREYLLELDGGQRRLRALLVAVANAPSYGGGMRICPAARMDDGLLDVLVVHPVPRAEFLRILPGVYRGSHVRHPQVEVVRARRVAIAADGIVGYADGERFAPLPLECELMPGALRVLAGGRDPTAG